ncbi:hypothetical protein [Globicatella sanguinis]
MTKSVLVIDNTGYKVAGLTKDKLEVGQVIQVFDEHKQPKKRITIVKIQDGNTEYDNIIVCKEELKSKF